MTRGGPERPLYLWLLLATLVLNIFSGEGSDALGLPISPDRLTLAASLGLLALDPWAWRRGRYRIVPAHVAMTALVLLAAWSALTSGTLLTPLGLFALADRLVVPFLLFAIAPVVFSTPQRRDMLLQTLVLLGLYLGTTAVLERVAPGLVFPRFIVDPSLGIQATRSRGPFLASEALGLVLVFCAAASAMLVARRRGVWRTIAASTGVLCAAGILLTLTRSIWLGAAAGVVLACLQHRTLRRLLPVIVVASTAFVVAVLVAVPSLQDAVSERATTTRSLDDRRNVNAAALRILEREPLTGVGWARFLDVNYEYVRQADTYPVTNTNIEVHNVVLARAAELGYPGALLWVSTVLLGPVRAAARKLPARDKDGADLEQWRLVLTAGGVTWLVSTMLSPVPYPLANYLIFLVAGLVLGPSIRPRLRRETVRSDSAGRLSPETGGAAS
ncbi:O-antigen ligase [uncultured Pseudokineococcus sp.]|uniref:O-antigen ligase family protein n=1 Tax=uncultured Pseudokineococcus sp. TaxID=1642928 RepID=UPI002607DF24|nr:O-antigen ligase family protein [uncultured Pseudokineococcus sp.]